FISAATRLRRQMATGFSSRRVRRQAGSQGRSHVRPRMPGKTFDSRLRIYASEYCPCAIIRMYSGTGVWAGHAHWQSTTLWKYAGFAVVVGCKRASSRGSTRRVAPGRVESTPAATSMLLRGFHYAAQGRPDSGTFVRQRQPLRLAAAREPPGRECEPVGRLAEQLALPLVPAVLAQEGVLRGGVHRASHAGQ